MSASGLRVAGHSAIRGPAREGGNPLPHCADGSLIVGRRTGLGHAKCQCGEVSADCLNSGAARWRWHTRHKEEIAGVPWSDAAIAARYA